MQEFVIAGRYRVIEELGQGGMGSVHRVIDGRDGRELALKRLVLSEQAKEKGVAELFEREYHALSELAHPRIIEVYDYGIEDGCAYYTMELLTGSDLRELGRQPWEKACALLRDLASSLAIVHSRRLIHGDLSPRNVRCTADGRAKLLDFGAMMPMGPTKRTIGTPPFVPPEMLHFSVLDGRTDIYGLGALAYWLLTGVHAYPARDFEQLVERWTIPPRAPQKFNAEIPQALSDLVMECLELDRSARPRTAGIVMERLCTIAALPYEEHEAVTAAYLTTPTLVGRSAQLKRIRQRLTKMNASPGAVIIAEGAPGSGRTRFLNACVLEAKLLGRAVLRIDSGDGGKGHGASRVLCEQLFALDREAAQRAARAEASLLAHVLDPDLVQAEPRAEAPSRQQLSIALRDFAVAACRGKSVVIAADDADRIDDESASLLVSLAQRAERRAMCLILAVDAQGVGSAALDVLRREAETLTLTPLDEAETEQLVQSLFGEVEHRVMLARRIFSVAGGNPRAILQLATHLVDRGIVRYEAGSFLLPDRLLDQDLPSSIGEALGHRLQALDADAFELGCALALTDPRELAIGDYSKLVSHGDRGRVYRAIDRLVRIELLVPEGDRYRLGDSTWRSVVEARLPEAETRALHAKLAEAFGPVGTVNRRAHHWMRSGQPEKAIYVLLAQYIKDPNEPRDPLEDYVPGVLDLLEEVANASEHLNIPAALKVELGMKTLGASQFVGDVARFRRMAPPLLEQLKRDSGLSDYAELVELGPAERLPEAFRRVQERYHAAPEHERGLSLFDAMREVARLCVMHSGMAATALDITVLDPVPSLAPLAALSPAIEAIQRMIDAMRLSVQGRLVKARAALLALIERLEQPDGAGLGELYARSMRFGSLYTVGLIEAGMGLPGADQRVKDLQGAPGHRVNAQRVHMTAHLMRGDVEQAAAAQRRAELAMLQDGQHLRYPGSTARTEMMVYALMEDLSAVKEVTERLVQAARGYPAWGVYAELGRCHYRRLQGDFQGAFAILKPALAQVAPLGHREWPALAAAHVQLLVDLGDSAEALRVGREYAAICKREELLPGLWQVSQALALALLAAGETGEAGRLVDGLIDEAIASNVRGLMLGTLYELRARTALAEKNVAEFERFSELCREEYRPDRVPALAAKFQRLMRDAERHGVGQSATASADLDDSPTVTLASLLTTAHSRLRECDDTKTRAEVVLKILTEQLAPKAAFLYGFAGGSFRLLGSVPQITPPEGLGSLVRKYLETEVHLDEADTTTAAQGPAALAATDDPNGPRLKTAPQLLEYGSLHIQPIALIATRDGPPRVAAVAALHVEPKTCTAPPLPLLEVLASALLADAPLPPAPL